ncbi:MAG TPA: hypothetical protein P5055_21380 [Candidatus Paceibacterota bacterium]|nr:hypothetical protein [Candidatus Paceibacterota bacterium]
MNKRTNDLLAVGLALCAIAGSLYYSLAGRSSRVDLSTYEALGAITADETATLLGNKGRVILIARDTGPDKNPSVEAQLTAFQRALKKHAGLSLLTDRFKAAPDMMMATGGGVPPDHLSKTLARHGKIDAMVLFCAIPPMADSELNAIRKSGAKVVVVSSFHSDYGRLLDQQLIHRVVAPQPESPPPGAPPPRTLRERFDQDYVIVTKANAAQWR